MLSLRTYKSFTTIKVEILTKQQMEYGGNTNTRRKPQDKERKPKEKKLSRGVQL